MEECERIITGVDDDWRRSSHVNIKMQYLAVMCDMLRMSAGEFSDHPKSEIAPTSIY